MEARLQTQPPRIARHQLEVALLIEAFEAIGTTEE